MSQLKKQAVVGRKPTRRNKPSSAGTPSASLGSRLRALTHWSTQIAAFTSWPLRASLKKWPKASMIVLASLTMLGAVGYGATKAAESLTQSLPTRLEISTPRAELFFAISKLSSDTLQTARAENWSRAALTDKLLSRISMVDGVDEVSIRAGLDKRLRIDVAAQAPLLVLEGKGNERILVGSKFKIIARGLSATDYGNLPLLEAPDLQLNISALREKKKAHSGLFVRPASISTANIRWLSQQAMKISSLFTANKLPVEVEKVLWRSGSGFSAIVRMKEYTGHAPVDGIGSSASTVDMSPPVAQHKVTIILGESQFSEKFERLSQVFQDLRLKKANVDQIDLAFSDKAVIRMSDVVSETKRGGLQ
ncbi:cell division protein FtsQ [bacterium]|nr:cell division protein FtsQ [bacterium]